MDADIVVESVKTAGNTEILPESKLSQKAYLNAVASLIRYAAKLGVGFVVTPILVHGLGSVMFGVWQILSRLVNHISAADGRPTQTLKWVVANKQASDDFAGKRRDVGSAIFVWLIFLPVLAIGGIIIVWLSPSIIKVSSEFHAVVRIACALLVVNLLLAGLIAVPSEVLKGMNLGYKRMGIVASITVIGGFLTAGAIILGWGLVGVAGAQVVISIITGIIFWLLVRKYVPWFGFDKPAKPELREFAGLSIWFTLWAFLDKLIISSDVVLLGIIASASSVTTYTLTGYFAILIAEILLNLAVGPVIPGLGGLIGQKKYKKAAAVRDEMIQIIWLLITASGTTILLWNQSFVHLWVGSDHFAGFWTNLFIVLVAMQFVFIRMDARVIDVTLDLRLKVVYGAAAAILSICLAILLIPLLGIVGLCISLIGGRMVLTISYPVIISSLFEVSVRRQFADMLRPGAVTILLLTFAFYLSQHILVRNWIELSVYSSLSFVLILCTGIYVGLNSEQRRRFIERFRAVRLFTYNIN